MKKKKSNKLIIVLAVVIVAAAVVLAVGLMKKNGGMDIFKDPSAKQSTLGSSQYVIQTPVYSSEVQNTDSWVNFDKFASDLATATDTSSTSVTGTTVSTEPLTSLVYVYVETSYIAPTGTEPTTKEPETTEPAVLDYKYTIDPSTKTVSLQEYIGKGYDKPIYIPTSIMGNKVTEIGEGCFAGKPVTSICIKDNITKIGKNAFRNCTELKSVVFLGSYDLDSVGEYAFRGCSMLTTINLPCTKRIETYAFGECDSLETLVVANGTDYIGDFCFSKCSKLKELTIPKSVAYIGTSALPAPNIAPDLVVKCAEGSEADTAAKKFEIRTEYIYQF